jgi:hypothetical protein
MPFTPNKHYQHNGGDNHIQREKYADAIGKQVLRE